MTDTPPPRALVNIPADAKVIMPKLGVCTQHFRRNDDTGASEPMTSVTLLSVVPSRGETRVSNHNDDARRLPDAETIELAFTRAARKPAQFAERAYGTHDALTEARETIEKFDILEIIDIITDLRPAMLRLKSNSPIKVLYQQAVSNFIEVVHHATGEDPDDIKMRLNSSSGNVARAQANASPSSTTAAEAEAAKAAQPPPFRKATRALPAAPAAPGRADIAAGNIVVYPGTGICRIMGIEQQSVAGIAMEMVVLSNQRDKATVSIPMAKAAKALGAMPDRKTMAHAIKTMRQRPKAKVSGPSARWIAHNKAKLDSYGLTDAAEVVRDLRAPVGTEIAYSYRVQLQLAFHTMSTYYAHIAKIDRQQALDFLTRYAGVDMGAPDSIRASEDNPAFDNAFQPSGAAARAPTAAGRRSGRHFD